MQAFAEEWDLDVPKRFNQHQLAKETDSLREFHVIYKTLSKYAHPTPMLLFGRESFLRGDNSRRALLLAAQMSAAWLLDDLPGLVEKLRIERSPQSGGTAA